MHNEKELRRLALGVLQPGFVGTTAPEWLLDCLRDGLGSVVLFSRNIETPEQVAALTARLRAENPELVIAIDEESGDVTRIESRTGSSRPGNHALGYLDDTATTHAVAQDLGHTLRAAGVSLDYAPSADVNSNPDKPIIGVRSFGADPGTVARHTSAWIRGLQSAGVAACAKHFPGHGDVAVDSHHGLPVYEAPVDDIARQALPPFRAAIAAGVRAMMSGHLLVPALDPDSPATLSRRILTTLLREELGYEGLIVTDAIEMGAVADQYGIEGAAVRALAAGADAICVGGENADPDIPRRLADALVAAVLAGDLPAERLADAARRVAEFATWSTALRENATGAPDPFVGLDAARRAIRLTEAARTRLPLTGAAHVVELAPRTNLAIGKETPWGLAAPLRARTPATTSLQLREEDLPADVPLPAGVLAPAEGRPLVVVVRDAGRHAWMRRALTDIVRTRPDALVVETGLPGPLPGEAHVCTHGASTASAQAVAALLTDGSAPHAYDIPQQASPAVPASADLT
ncbi:glycoside hydrolase family 3 protein [Streptomyces sp. NRRL F-5630]|uniref:glycoside hydrolase family 3 protein n=1 Tax=Streptomyces sp. NRRL F-5630 TaxID=1463864 RepID=UPI003EB72A0F